MIYGLAMNLSFTILFTIFFVFAFIRNDIKYMIIDLLFIYGNILMILVNLGVK